MRGTVIKYPFNATLCKKLARRRSEHCGQGRHEDKLLTVLESATQPWPVKCYITLSQKNNNIDLLYYLSVICHASINIKFSVVFNFMFTKHTPKRIYKRFDWCTQNYLTKMSYCSTLKTRSTRKMKLLKL